VTTPLKIITIIGARPQFIKAAPVAAALKAAGITEILIHTGQHFDANMSAIFFQELGIPAPTHQLDINGGGHGAMTGRMMQELEPLFQQHRPDAVLIYGDTNSTLAGALVAAKLHIPVAHVEAGLRSYNRAMPEEINRVLADHVSALLFCPTPTAVANLAAEGITANVHMVGDVMYDATLTAITRAATESKILTRLKLTPRHYAVATIHRAESTDDPATLRRIVAYLAEAAAQQPIILPLHPRTRQCLASAHITLPTTITAIDPLGYLDMTQLAHHAALILTDSGGLQKEAYFHRIPCVTLRTETEWVETVTAGWNRLWTTQDYATPRHDIPAYGTGHAAEVIAGILQEHYRCVRAT
jgi:UDP-GlcNAc3NAcA epimerase